MPARRALLRLSRWACGQYGGRNPGHRDSDETADRGRRGQGTGRREDVQAVAGQLAGLGIVPQLARPRAYGDEIAKRNQAAAARPCGVPELRYGS